MSVKFFDTISNKAAHREQRRINTALQVVGFQPAFAPRDGELKPERLNGSVVSQPSPHPKVRVIGILEIKLKLN